MKSTKSNSPHLDSKIKAQTFVKTTRGYMKVAFDWGDRHYSDGKVWHFDGQIFYKKGNHGN